jgi:hypothetical protein
MEQTIDTQTPAQKIYKSNAVRLGAFFGGPLVAGYLIAENFKAFDEPDKARKTWIYTVVAAIAIVSIAFATPGNGRLGEYLMPLVYAWVAYYLVVHYQGDSITAHINAGGGFYNWGRVIVVALIGIAITLVAVFAIAYASETATSTEAVKTYGAAQSEVHYDKTNISATEVNKIGQAFVGIGLFASSTKIFTYVKKTGSNYEISISCNNTVTTDPQVGQAFTQLRAKMQQQFPQNKIIFNMVVDRLDNVVKRIE